MKTILFSALAVLSVLSGFAEGPKIDIVTGADPHRLVTLSAEQLSGQFERLFDAEVKISAKLADGAKHVVLLGSPDTNPAIPASAWPKELGDEAHFLKTVDGKLIAGGGSSPAGYWAACELGRHFGFRYLLHGDFPPLDTPEFSLDGFDVVFEPNIQVRAWKSVPRGPASQESWGIAEHQQLLGQLAKLKFNQVILKFDPGQPFIDSGDGETGGVLWNGEEFRVDGESAGRSVFDRASVFENPDFAGKTTYVERVEAGKKLANGIVKTAHDLGMKTSIEVDKSHAAAARTTYEDADWADGQLTPVRLGQKNGGILPQLVTSSLPGKLADVRESSEGFAVECAILGDHEADVAYLSLASFDAEITPRAALDDLVTPICGEGVSDRLALGFAAIEKVSALIEKEDPDFATPDPDMFMEHYRSSEAEPEWWAEAAGLYGEAVNEMYRGNTRSRDGARQFVLYHAKRYTFALHYISAVQAARAAGVANGGGDEDVHVESLESSVEAMHNALAIYTEVVRDNSDRGVIAVLNKYGYRPLLEALEDAPPP